MPQKTFPENNTSDAQAPKQGPRKTVHISHNGVCMTASPLRTTPVRQRAIIETTAPNLRSIRETGRQSEGRRDRRADRYLNRPPPGRPGEKGAALAMYGRTAIGRRYRIRFVPQDGSVIGRRIA